MNCQILAERLQRLEPDSDTRDIARLCLLVANAVDSVEELSDPERLKEVWRKVTLRMQVANDQHAAMTEELEQLAQSDPREFNRDQIWILIRAIKVQSQILHLYLGGQPLDV